MSYGIDESTQETNVPSIINAGIQENIKLESVEFAPFKEGGDDVIQLHFVDEFDSRLNISLWPIDEDQVREWARSSDNKHSRTNKELGFVKGEPITPDDKVIMEYDLFNQRAKHIAARFADEETITETMEGAGSYQEFGEAYVTLFKDSVLANTYLRLKVVLNSKDYSKLPKYPPFIESMDVPKEKSRLELTEYDRVEKASPDTGADDPMSVAGGAGGGLPDEPTF